MHARVVVGAMPVTVIGVNKQIQRLSLPGMQASLMPSTGYTF